MNDFPDWFVSFSTEQLESLKSDISLLEQKPLPELQIDYLKVWSVIESFSKIVVTLAEKRNFLKDLKPQMKVIEQKTSELAQIKQELQKAIRYYESSIDGQLIDWEVDAIRAFPKGVKKKDCKKFSVDKNIVFRATLPNRATTEKSLQALEFGVMKFCSVVNQGTNGSKYYSTRNKIAHEGIIDVEPITFIKDRFVTILDAAREIHEFVLQLREKSGDWS